MKHSSRGFTTGLVSIVTPTLHAARFLRETLESVLGQTYQPIEYVVVDSGSHDDTASIVRTAGGKVTFLTAPRLNQAQAINHGFAHAQGEFFAFLNADDTLYPQTIESAVSALRAAPSAPFAYGDALHVDALGRPIAAYPSHAFSYELLRRECFVCQPATLIRSSAFKAAGGLNEALETAFDYDLWIRLSAGNQIPVKVDELWATSRMHAGSKSIRQRSIVFGEIFRLLEQHYDYVPFNWVHAYAGYLVDGKDHFFELPTGSLRRTLLTLRLGLWRNRRHLVRFAREFGGEIVRLRRAARSEGGL